LTNFQNPCTIFLMKNVFSSCFAAHWPCLIFLILKRRIFRSKGVRLANGAANRGRVEVYYNGQWGTVCSHGWQIETAGSVVCRQLGFARARATYFNYNNVFFVGKTLTSPIWMNRVTCYGHESTLFECKHAGWGNQNRCRHEYDVGIECVSFPGENERDKNLYEHV
jgi:deleted-in-malignant-brain-tumors protein 1